MNDSIEQRAREGITAEWIDDQHTAWLADPTEASFPAWLAERIAALSQAQPVEFDRARETRRRQSAVELLLSQGYTWQDGQWHQPAAQQGEATWRVLQIGGQGAFYDPPNTRRAYTYEHQPGNILASRLGSAFGRASCMSAGDLIDRGLCLLSALQEAGFGVFQIEPSTAPPAQPQEVPETWRPMETAPRDGTMVRLLVEFEDHATEDTEGPAPTIGANSFGDTGEDRWRFAGWCWTHDHFTEGEGTPVGWLPMLDDAQPAAQQGDVVKEAAQVMGEAKVRVDACFAVPPALLAATAADSLRHGIGIIRVEHVPHTEFAAPPAQQPSMSEGAIQRAMLDGFKVEYCPPASFLTDEANAESAWLVGRSAPPFCDRAGNRSWSAPTPQEAIARAREAVGLPESAAPQPQPQEGQ